MEPVRKPSCQGYPRSIPIDPAAYQLGPVSFDGRFGSYRQSSEAYRLLQLRLREDINTWFGTIFNEIRIEENSFDEYVNESIERHYNGRVEWTYSSEYTEDGQMAIYSSIRCWCGSLELHRDRRHAFLQSHVLG